MPEKPDRSYYNPYKSRERQALVLAPSRSNPRVRRWQLPRSVADLKGKHHIMGAAAIAYALLRGADPDEMRRRLDRTVAAMREAARRHKERGYPDYAEAFERAARHLERRGHAVVDTIEAVKSVLVPFRFRREGGVTLKGMKKAAQKWAALKEPSTFSETRKLYDMGLGNWKLLDSLIRKPQDKGSQ